jgi:hypothetical protein
MPLDAYLSPKSPTDLPEEPFFQGADGRAQLVSAAALQQTFGAAGSSVKLVVLNACYSDVQAEALLAHVDCVVGMSGAIEHDAARNFAIGFYGGLGERESVAAAYRQGCAAISLVGLRDGEKPALKVRAGVDASQSILSAGDVVVPPASPPQAGLIDFTAERQRHAQFLGREDVLARLDECLDGSRETGWVVVIGGPGMGKSAILSAWLLRREATGAVVAHHFIRRQVADWESTRGDRGVAGRADRGGVSRAARPPGQARAALAGVARAGVEAAGLDRAAGGAGRWPRRDARGGGREPAAAVPAARGAGGDPVSVRDAADVPAPELARGA